MLIISTGLMTMRAIETADALHRDSVDVGVLHVPTLKPLDEATIVNACRRTGRLVVVAENHTVIGGLGEAVACVVDLADQQHLLDSPLADGLVAHIAGQARMLRADRTRSLLGRRRIDVQDHDASAFVGKAFGGGPAETTQRRAPGDDGDLIFQLHGECPGWAGKECAFTGRVRRRRGSHHPPAPRCSNATCNCEFLRSLERVSCARRQRRTTIVERSDKNLAAWRSGERVKIFVSYAAEDRGVAEAVALALTGAGHEVFIDRNGLAVGGDYHARIGQAIRKCEVVVFLASRASLAPGCYTLTELKLAREKWPHPRGHLLTIRLNDIGFEEMPAYLTSVTVLEPEGNVAAEAVAALAGIERGRAPRIPRNVLVATALLAGLVGIGGAIWKMGLFVATPPPSTLTPESSPTASQPASNPLAPAAILTRLTAQGVVAFPAHRDAVLGWMALPDGPYQRVAEGLLELLGQRQLRSTIDIEVVMDFYKKAFGLDDENKLPAKPRVDLARLERALIAAYNETYGAGASRLEDIFL